MTTIEEIRDNAKNDYVKAKQRIEKSRLLQEIHSILSKKAQESENARKLDERITVNSEL
ncbi:4445_t:CDS:2 [Funneliformis mosseae]|uniref:4445_t:CDS:1 n=1 Tax=Funneliformis mosseae TaxID=27381 RepID=A0A9N9ECF9_FUNMO|nr:4445_t:CDS:2 [Funneliformis mosseae]